MYQRKSIREIWSAGVLAARVESWRQIPDGFGPDFTNFLLVVVAEDEGGVLIKSLKITGGANEAMIPGLNIVPRLREAIKAKKS